MKYAEKIYKLCISERRYYELVTMLFGHDFRKILIKSCNLKLNFFTRSQLYKLEFIPNLLFLKFIFFYAFHENCVQQILCEFKKLLSGDMNKKYLMV